MSVMQIKLRGGGGAYGDGFHTIWNIFVSDVFWVFFLVGVTDSV